MKNILTGIDIGTTKIAVIIAEKKDNTITYLALVKVFLMG